MASAVDSIGIGETAITRIDGERGVLSYRGYRVDQLVDQCSYETVVELLLSGALPGAADGPELVHKLAGYRELPTDALAVLEALPSRGLPIDGLRTAVSAMGDLASVYPPAREACLRLIGRIPVLVARLFRRAHGLAPIASDPELGHAANLLSMLHGGPPNPQKTRALERYLILLADHGISASTFVLRVVLSTRSDLASAVAAALGALKGPLHGGAPSGVLDMLDAVGTSNRAESWIAAALARRERLYGFGHPVYRVEDPRATLLRGFAREVADPGRYALARGFEEAALAALRSERPTTPIHTNVDFYGAVLLEAVGLPRDFFTPVFALARTAGWSAHALEQVVQNRLVRPPERYVGPEGREIGGSASPTDPGS